MQRVELMREDMVLRRQAARDYRALVAVSLFQTAIMLAALVWWVWK